MTRQKQRCTLHHRRCLPRGAKVILRWTPFYSHHWSTPQGISIFRELNCEDQACVITDRKSVASISDVIVFHMRDAEAVSNLPTRSRPPGQRWLFFLLESPHNSEDTNYSRYNNLFNWTSTYSSSSDLPCPYGRYLPGVGSSGAAADMDFITGKTRLVAWMVSHCRTVSLREEFALNLARYVSLHIYGPCRYVTPHSTVQQVHYHHCSFTRHRECLRTLGKTYKFYLAFENSKCREYITEKFWLNALSSGMVPVVMGGSKEDYVKVAPPHSFIHVDDFSSAKELGEYLVMLDGNDTLYQQYLAWNRFGHIETEVLVSPSHSSWWCRLCAALHNQSLLQAHTQRNNLHTWWSIENQCNLAT